MQERRQKENIILIKSIQFAVEIITFCEKLEDERKYVIAKQLLRSGTSVGANIHEAQNCESKRDFIHKLKIAAKELDETQYWLMLCEKVNSYPTPSSLIEQKIEISKILNKIIATSKRTLDSN